MENVLFLFLFIALWMYKAVENCLGYCVEKCTHVDKKGLGLFFKGYTQTMLSLIRGCKQFVGVRDEFN